MDTQPVNAGHVLIVSSSHFSYLNELNEDIESHMFRIAHKIAKVLRKSDLKCKSVNMFLANGKVAI